MNHYWTIKTSSAHRRFCFLQTAHTTHICTCRQLKILSDTVENLEIWGSFCGISSIQEGFSSNSLVDWWCNCLYFLFRKIWLSLSIFEMVLLHISIPENLENGKKVHKKTLENLEIWKKNNLCTPCISKTYCNVILYSY